jgi:hypothetical protein
MNNCHLLNVYKHTNKHEDNNTNYDLDDFQDSYDVNYIYYQCYVDDKNRFRYFETSPNSVTQHPTSALHKISKNIPTFFHKTLLYFKYIPKFF